MSSATHGAAGRRRVPLSHVDWSSHRAFLGVFAIAVLLRLGVEVAYHPLLMQVTDAWGYLAHSRPFDPAQLFVITPERPLGYPGLLALLWSPLGFHTTVLTVAQHLAGLVTGLLGYSLLRRWQVPAPLAAAAAAVILWDLRAIALEQSTMPEAFFTAGTMAALALTIVGAGRPWHLFAAGLLLGVTSTLRFAALPALPIWALYVLLRNWRNWNAVALAVIGISFPLVAYATAHAGATGRLGFTDASGFFLYGRTAHLADCNTMHPPADLRFLCETSRPAQSDPNRYIWTAESPARKVFQGWGATPDITHAQDAVVGEFARLTIKSDPVGYAKLVASDFFTNFIPGSAPYGPEGPVDLYADVNPDAGPLGAEALPGYQNQSRWPSGLMADLHRVLRTPRWLIGLLSLIAVVAVIRRVPPLRRRTTGTGRTAEVALLAGIGLTMLVFASATASFGLRYLVASAPILVVGGTLAFADLTATLRARRRAQAEATVSA